MVSDLHSIIRVALGRQDQPGAVVPDGRTLQCAGAVAGGACNARQRARARLGANAVRGAATGYGPDGQAGLGRSGPHG